MANFVFNRAAFLIANQTLNLATATLGVLLINSDYTPDRDTDYIDEGGAADIVDAEITAVTSYVRKAVSAGKQWALDDTNDMAWFDSNNPATWSPLGGAANDDIAGVVLYQNSGDDLTSVPIAFYDTADGFPAFPFTTTGGEFTVQVNVLGWINLKTNP